MNEFKHIFQSKINAVITEQKKLKEELSLINRKRKGIIRRIKDNAVLIAFSFDLKKTIDERRLEYIRTAKDPNAETVNRFRLD